MRVLEISKFYPPHRGGIEAVAGGVSEKLAEMGHNVIVCTSDVPKKSFSGFHEELDNPSIHRSSCWLTVFNTPFCPGMLNTMLREDYDVVNIHLPDPFGNMLLNLAQWFRMKPVVVTYHADIVKSRWYHRLFMALYRHSLDSLLGYCATITATTRMYAESSDVLATYLGKVTVIPNFVDIEKYKPGNSKREHHDGLRVLFVGRFVPYKGLKTLIDAVKGLDVEVHLVGNGPMYDELKKYALDNHVELTFHINAQDLREEYEWCDVLVLPSVTRQEAFGITLIEAMACGKPVIGSNIGGVPEVVGHCGCVFEAGNAESLRKCLKSFNPSEWDPVKIREYAIERFSLDKVAKQYEEVIKCACRMGDPE